MFNFRWNFAKLDSEGFIRCSLDIPVDVRIDLRQTIQREKLFPKFKVSRINRSNGMAAKLMYLKKHTQQHIILRGTYVFAFKKVIKSNVKMT